HVAAVRVAPEELVERGDGAAEVAGGVGRLPGHDEGGRGARVVAELAGGAGEEAEGLLVGALDVGLEPVLEGGLGRRHPLCRRRLRPREGGEDEEGEEEEETGGQHGSRNLGTTDDGRREDRSATVVRRL